MPFAMCPPDYNINVNVNTQPTQASFRELVDVMNQVNSSVKGVKDALDAKGSTTQRVKKSVEDYKGTLADLNRELTANKTLQKEQQGELARLIKKYGDSSTQVKTQENALRGLTKTINQQTSQLKQYNKELGITSTKTKQATSGLQGLTTTFNKLGAVMGVSFGLYGVFRVLQDGIKTIASFDLEQKKLRSILGETAEGMKEVSKSAMELGKASIFGAKGVSELQVELGKMGFTKGDIMDMQEAIVNLATATQEELAPSAEVVANIIRAYNLTAADATRVTDVMGKAFNDSALDLSNFREAIKYVGPVAKQAGFTIEQTVAALELLSQVGIKGSLAGTGLNNVLKAMMDGNSKLSKSLGGTVKGYEGFLSVLRKAKEEGWDTEQIFGVITQRATAAFTTFANGVETIEDFRKSLENANGVMKEQAVVQLGSLTYQAKLTKEAFHNLWLEIENGEGVIAKVFGGIMQVARMFMMSEGSRIDAISKYEKILSDLDKSIRLAEARGLTATANTMKIQAEELNKFLGLVKSKNELWYQGNAKLINMWAINAEESIKGVTEKSANVHLKRFDDALIANKGNIEKARKETTDWLLAAKEGAKGNELAMKEYALAIELVDKKAASLKGGKGGKTLTAEEIEAQKKAQEEFNKLQVKLLEIQKQRALEEIKATKEGADEKIATANTVYEYDVKIAKLTIENQQELVAQLDLLNAKKVNSLRDAYGEMKQLSSKRYKDELLTEKEITTNFLKQAEERVKANDALIELLLDADKGKNKPKNPTGIQMLFPNADEDQQEALQKGFDLAKDGISDLADAWVDSMDRIVDARNNMVDEAQQALETELQLAELGYASNVTLKRKELENAKKLRQEALNDQKKAQKAQAALDLANTTSSLIVSAAQIFAGTTKLGIFGVPVGIGLVLAMLAAMKKFQTQIKSANEVAKYGEGGWVGGKLHREGGTTLEAEKGEFITNRKSSLKHAKLLEAINNDDSYTLNRLYINNLKGQIVNARVSLDDSKDLKAIRSVLEKENRKVEYYSNYRIEKNGNVTTKILLN